MNDRLSNEHGHNLGDKVQSEESKTVDSRELRLVPPVPNPKGVPANEGGQDDPHTQP